MFFLWMWRTLHTELLGVAGCRNSPHSPVSNLRNAGLSWSSPAWNPPVAFHQGYARTVQSTQNLHHLAVIFLLWLTTVFLALRFPVGCWATPTIFLTPDGTLLLLYLGPYILFFILTCSFQLLNRLSYSFIWKLSSPPRSLLSYYRNLPDSSPVLLAQCRSLHGYFSMNLRLIYTCVQNISKLHYSLTSSIVPSKENAVLSLLTHSKHITSSQTFT